MDSLNNIKI